MARAAFWGGLVLAGWLLRPGLGVPWLLSFFQILPAASPFRGPTLTFQQAGLCWLRPRSSLRPPGPGEGQQLRGPAPPERSEEGPGQAPGGGGLRAQGLRGLDGFSWQLPGTAGRTEGPGVGASGGLRAPLPTSSAGVGTRGPSRTPGRSARPWRPLVLEAGTGPAAPLRRTRCRRSPDRAGATSVPAGTAGSPGLLAGCVRAAARGGHMAGAPSSDPRGPGSRLGLGPAGPHPPTARGVRSQGGLGAPPASQTCPGPPCARDGATPEHSLGVRFWVLLQTHNKSRSCDLFASKNASSTWRVPGCTARGWPRPRGATEHLKRNPSVPLT